MGNLSYRPLTGAFDTADGTAFLHGSLVNARVAALPFLLLTTAAATAAPPEVLPGFHRSPWFNEQVRERWVEGSVRVLVNAPEVVDPKRPTRLVIYATPNGNTIEQTLGCGKADGLDWHFDIQHVAAQVRRLRELSRRRTSSWRASRQRV